MKEQIEGVDYKEINTVTMNGVTGVMRVDIKYSNAELYKRIFDIETKLDILYPQRDDMIDLEVLADQLNIREA